MTYLLVKINDDGSREELLVTSDSKLMFKAFDRLCDIKKQNNGNYDIVVEYVRN